MKDVRKHEIKVGDTVVYTRRYCVSPLVGEVTAASQETVSVGDVRICREDMVMVVVLPEDHQAVLNQLDWAEQDLASMCKKFD